MFTTFLHSRFASVGLASVIALSVLGTAGIAMAEGSPSSDTPSATGQAAPGAARPHARGILKGLMRDIVARSGLSQDVFKQGFKDGKSFNDILGANGKDAATVKAAVTTDAKAKISDAVLKGTITQEQADKATEKLPVLLEKMLSGAPRLHAGRGGLGGHIRAIGKNVLTTVAGVMGKDVAALKAELKGGKTIAQVAGPQTAAVIAALDAKADTAIDKAVTNGKIPPENADVAKTKVHARITNFVNNGRPHRVATP